MDKNSGVIYIITNKITKKQYIGQAVNYLSNGKIWGSFKRWKKHVSNALNNNSECRLLENSILKYGENNFIVKDIIICNIENLNYAQYVIKIERTTADRVDEKKFKFKKCADKKSA